MFHFDFVIESAVLLLLCLGWWGPRTWDIGYQCFCPTMLNLPWGATLTLLALSPFVFFQFDFAFLANLTIAISAAFSDCSNSEFDLQIIQIYRQRFYACLRF